MNKNIEPGKTLYNLRDGMEHLKVALTAESKGTRQTAWVIFKEFWLWPLTFLSLLAIFWQTVFHFWQAVFHFVFGW